MRPLARLTPEWIVAIVALAAIGLSALAGGTKMFSPGPLNAQQVSGAAPGGVRSHAELYDNCGACHAPPWSGKSMAALCQACHTNVRDQVENRRPLHGRLSENLQCRDCHPEHNGPEGGLTSMAGFNHDLAAFPLTGKHVSAACETCHIKKVYRGTPQACVACHPDPQVHKGRLGADCEQCHSTFTWKYEPGKFNHDLAAYKLTGKHKTTACKACHTNNVYRNTPQACVVCHADPPVHNGRFGVECAECHTTISWKPPVFQPGKFDHDLATFKLTGKHVLVVCDKCHVKNAYRGTGKTCIACHPEPQVHSGRLGIQCAECHSTSTWKYEPDKFNHDLAAFRLTGKHASVACDICHVKNVYRGTAQTCVACHSEPEVHKGRLGIQCAECHSTSTWKYEPGNFNHDLSPFKLTGKHKTTACAACHVKDVYQGTAQTCIACHPAPQGHKGRFGSNCVECHSTGTWRDAKFKHDAFPLNHGHGKRGTTSCETCHTASNNYRLYTCCGCHEHDPDRIARKHSGKRIPDLQDCVRCHAGGRKHEGREGRRN